jgi:hypothetical protein
MAFAPGVSIEYWQELAERKAQLMADTADESEDAAHSLIVADKLDEAIAIFEKSEEFEDAKLVRSL